MEPGVIALPVQAIYEGNRIYRVVNNRLEGVNVDAVGDFVDEAGRHTTLVRANAIGSGDQIITTQLPRAISGLLVEPIDTGKLVEAVASQNGGERDEVDARQQNVN